MTPFSLRRAQGAVLKTTNIMLELPVAELVEATMSTIGVRVVISETAGMPSLRGKILLGKVEMAASFQCMDGRHAVLTAHCENH